MKTSTFILLLLLTATTTRVDSALAPNRGHQLFVLIEGGTTVTTVAMTLARRGIYSRWNKEDARYDFVFAVAKPVSEGSKVMFTRYVMKSDWIPRVETLELFFPYAKQPQHRFFDIGRIVGFYRNSEKDFDPHELRPQTPHSSSTNKNPLR